MCNKTVFGSLARILVMCMALLAGTVKAEGTNVTVTVMGRGLSEGLYVVSEFYEKSVNLEEPGCNSDLSRCERSAPGADFWSLKTRLLQFSFSPTGSVFEAIGSALTANKQADPSVTYSVVTNQSWPGVLTVIPEHWEGGAGVQKGIASLLSTRVTIGQGPESSFEHFKAAMEAASPYEDMIILSGAPPRTQVWADAVSEISTNEMAMTVLSKLFCKPPDRWSKGRSWHFLRGLNSGGKRKAVLEVRGFKHPDYANACDMDRFVISLNERPMANAIQVVSHDIRKSIGYEDPDLERSSYRDVVGKAYRTGMGAVYLRYLSSWKEKAILEAMVKKFRYGSCDFRATEEDGFSCVLPHRKYTGRRGDVTDEEYHPISTNTIAVVTDDTNAFVVVSDICRQLGKASGKTVVLSKEAEGILLSMRAPLKAQGGPGWLALSKCLREVSESLNWRLLHKPATDRYVLDVYDRTKPIVILGGDPSQPAEADGDAERALK